MRFSPLSCLLLIGGVASLLAGCGGATSPASTQLATSYDLVSYEGHTLPVETRVLVYVSTEPGGPSASCSDRLTAMKILFLTANTYAQSESRLLVCDDGRPDVTSSNLISGTYALSGGTLELVADLGGSISQHYFARSSGRSLTVYRREILYGLTLQTFNEAPLIFAATP